MPDLVTFPAGPTALVLGVVIVLLGVLPARRGFEPRRRCPGCSPPRSCRFVVAFLCWVAARGSTGDPSTSSGCSQNTIGLAVPLILGALAGVLCERSGVINVAIEGQMLAGAWAAALIGSVVGTTSARVVAGDDRRRADGRAAGRLRDPYLVNQVVLGVVLNVFALGLTGFFYDAFMQPQRRRR